MYLSLTDPLTLRAAHWYYRAGRLREAEAACKSALAREPSNSDALHLLGVLALRANRFDESVALLRRAIGSRPEFPDAFSNLGVALEARGQLVKAENACRAALRLDPRHVPAWDNLGNALKKQGRVDEAADAYRAALRVRPDDPVAHNGLGAALLDLGRADEGVARYRKARDFQPSSPAAHSDLLYVLHYHDGYDADALYREHVEWDRRYGEINGKPSPQPSPGVPGEGEARPGRRLRVGYVSPDFREHTVPRFIGAPLRHHDRERFEVFLYSDAARPDATTARLRALGHAWRDCAGLGTGQLDRLVHDDRIDVLVDLRGHGAGNRLPLFARRAAPVQVSMVGYFDTTGLSAMDYRLTDEWMDPPGASERFHTEKLLRLGRTCWCYEPDADAPEVAPPPAASSGHVTFGSLNKVAKISPSCARLWAQVLHAVPGSRLLLSVGGADARGTLRARLGEMGLPPSRLDVIDKAPRRREYLQGFGRIDVVLDTFPFNGITTTCDGLWMGVPAVSLSGDTSVSRAGRSILGGPGLSDLAADTPAAFVGAAVQLARDAVPRAAMRAGMRERMAGSPLCDAVGFTRTLEAAYDQITKRKDQDGVKGSESGRPHFTNEA